MRERVKKFDILTERWKQAICLWVEEGTQKVQKEEKDGTRQRWWAMITSLTFNSYLWISALPNEKADPRFLRQYIMCLRIHSTLLIKKKKQEEFTLCLVIIEFLVQH